MIWKDRLVKVEGNALMLSARGRHDDFEFFPEQSSDDMAIAFGDVSSAEILPDGRLLLHRPPMMTLDTGDISKMTLVEYKP